MRPGGLHRSGSDNRYSYAPMHFWRVMGYYIQTLLWGFNPNEMSTISHCYVSVFWLQSHILLCNFVGSPVFWNPPGHKAVGRGRARIPDVTIPCVFCPAELSSAELWFVELSVSRMRAPMHSCATRYLVNTTPLWFRENIELLAWF